MRSLLLALLMIPSVCLADSAVIRGAGTDTCAAYLENLDRPNAEQFKVYYGTWIMGFLSGHNMMNTRQASADPASAVAYLDNFCWRNPFMRVVDAAAALVSESGGASVAFQYRK